MEIDLTNLIIAIINILAVLLGAVSVKYIIPWIKEKNLSLFAREMVRVAYSLYENGKGEEKMKYALNKIQEKYGKWFNVDEIISAIQSAYVDFCIERGVDPSSGKEVIENTKLDSMTK